MIIDALIYCGELDVLLVRLHELADVVDKFVIVEALEHHGSNRPRTATLAENWQAIKPFEHKIKYEVLAKLDPPHTSAADSWPRENFHRNSLLTPIVEVAKSQLGANYRDAVVLISDCDEIPRAEALTSHSPYSFPLGFEQDFFYYTVNNYLGKWNGTVGTTLDNIMAMGAQYFREGRDRWPRIPDGGWHFSYFGGLDRVKHKLANFAHAAEDSSKLVLCRTDVELAEDLANGRDLYQRAEMRRIEWRSESDLRLPLWLRQNMPKLWTEKGLRESLCTT